MIKNRVFYRQLLDLLFDNVFAQGGDGWGLWYNKYYTIDEIYDFINQEYLTKTDLEFWEIEKKKDNIIFSNGEEHVLITTNEVTFEKYSKPISFYETILMA